MDTIVIRIWRALTRSPEDLVTPAGARVLPAYAALAADAAPWGAPVGSAIPNLWL